MIGFIAVYSLSLGPVSWIGVSEILPPKGVTLTIALDWACITVLSFIFNNMLEKLGNSATFLLFAAINLAVLPGFLQERGNNQNVIDYGIWIPVYERNEGK